MYFIDRIVRGLGNVVYNGFEEVYVNAAVKDGTDVAALMKVFTEDAAYDDSKGALNIVSGCGSIRRIRTGFLQTSARLKTLRFC